MSEREAFVAMLTRVGIPFEQNPIESKDTRMNGIPGIVVSISSYDGVHRAQYPMVKLFAYGEGGADFYFNVDGVLLAVLAWGQ